MPPWGPPPGRPSCWHSRSPPSTWGRGLSARPGRLLGKWGPLRPSDQEACVQMPPKSDPTDRPSGTRRADEDSGSCVPAPRGQEDRAAHRHYLLNVYLLSARKK